MIVAALLLVPAGSAWGAQVRIEQNLDARGLDAGTTLRYLAASGEANRVVVSYLSGHRLRIVDPGASIEAPDTCEKPSPHEVTCTADGLVVSGGDGDDELEIPYGTAFGGPGDDLVVGAAGGDELHGGGGHDTLRGLAGGDRLYDDDAPATGIDADTLDGGAGQDRVAYPRLEGAVSVDLSASVTGDGDRLSGIESVGTTAPSSTLIGDAGANNLSASYGRNRLVGGAGDDFLGADSELRDEVSGGVGDDTLVLSTGFVDETVEETDALACGPGRDRVVFAIEAQLVPSDCERVDQDADYEPSYMLHLPLRDLDAPVAGVAYGQCGNEARRGRCRVEWVVRAGTRELGRRAQDFPASRHGPRVGLRLSPAGRRLLHRRRVVRAEIGVEYGRRVEGGFRVELRAPR